MTWLRRIDPNEFGENPTKPNFLFNFPSSASSGRKFRNFQRAIHTNLSNVLLARRWKKNLKSGNIAFSQKSMKAMIWLYSSTVAAKTRHIWEWKPDLVRKNWKACAACSTSYNGQIEQFINLYKIPLVTLHPLTIFHWNVWFARFSTLQDWSSSMFQCSKL